MMSKYKDLANKYQLDLILLFGSSASGDARSGSDIDIAVYGKKILSETEKVWLTYELGEILHSDDLDLIDLRTASAFLGNEVFKNYKVLYQGDEMVLFRLESANLQKIREIETLRQIRRERLEEFVR